MLLKASGTVSLVGLFLCRCSSVVIANSLGNFRAYTYAAPACSSSFSHGAKRVGTHSGSFHCDEALGCFMIRLSNRFSNAQIIRTRDSQGSLLYLMLEDSMTPSIIDHCDRHQKGFNEVFGYGHSTELSSAGLVCKHYGEEIVVKEVQLDEGHPDVHLLFLTVYNFMEATVHLCIIRQGKLVDRLEWQYRKAVDATDNGINQYNTGQPPRFVNNTSLCSRVGRLNLDWTHFDQSPEHENHAFQQAMELVGKEFLEKERAVDPTGEVIVQNRSFPLSAFQQWKLHIFELERELKIDPSIIPLVVDDLLYQHVHRRKTSSMSSINERHSLQLLFLPQRSNSNSDLIKDDRSQNWHIQAVAVLPGKFESWKPLPSLWRGLNDRELCEATRIPGCTSVHEWIHRRK